MSSPAPRRSIDNSESPRSISSNSQYPFPQYDSPQRPGSSGRYGTRHGSTASSITSIGRVLDPSSQGRKEPIAEFGNNGIYSVVFTRKSRLPYHCSDCYTSSTPHCSYWASPTYKCPYCTEAALNERYTSRRPHQHSTYRIDSFQAVPNSSRLPVRGFPTCKGGWR